MPVSARTPNHPGLAISTDLEDVVIDVLVTAFRSEPHNGWMFRTDGLRDEAFAHYLHIYLSEIARKGALFVSSVEKDACAIIGPSVEVDHHLPLGLLLRLTPAVIRASTLWRLHRVLAMEHALGKGHRGLRHLPHLVFMGAKTASARSTIRIANYLRQNFPDLVAETADPRVAALACRNGAVETGRARPLFGGPEMIFLRYNGRVETRRPLTHLASSPPKLHQAELAEA